MEERRSLGIQGEQGHRGQKEGRDGAHGPDGAETTKEALMPTVRTAGGRIVHLPYTEAGKAKASAMARRGNGTMMRVARRRKKGNR